MIRQVHKSICALAGVALWGATCASDLLAASSEAAWGRSVPLHVPANGRTGFTLLSSSVTGIAFTNTLSRERSITNQIYLNGSGVALGDVDGDGRCDIYLCGLEHGNALYRNLGGWRFEDITQSAGVGCADQASTGAVFADVDGDGDLDLLVNSIGRGVRLFLNDGHGRFREATEQAGLGGRAGGTSLALADVDGDGALDLYAVNYRTHTLRDEPDTRFKVATTNGQFTLLAVNGQSVTSPELLGRFAVDRAMGIIENGEPDVLYHNDGHGRFIPVSWTNGAFLDETGRAIAVPYDWGLSAMFRDLNDDGAPDLYVCNDFQSEDRIWINDGHGRFRAIAPLSLRHTSLFSMGVDFADVDRDGHDEIFVADMLSRSHARRQVQVADRKMMPPPVGMINDRPQYSRNMLFWNRGDGTWCEVAQLSGVEAADWCWCPVFLDVDLDGYEDLLMVTGHERDAMNIDVSRRIEATLKQRPLPRLAQLQLRRFFPAYDTPNFAFRNRGDLTFEEVGASWGFNAKQVSQGIALADLDGDGDLDVVINCLNAGPLIYRNDSIAPRIAVRLQGTSPNTQGIGSKIRVLGGAVPVQSQEVICGGRYLSGDDPMRVFAGGSVTNQLRVEVRWRSGKTTVVSNAAPNQLYLLEEPAGATSPAKPPATQHRALWFEDQSPLLSHTHPEDTFDDFQRQPLLPRRFSQGGPGVSCYDLDGDGWDDVVIGAGRGGQMAVFRNNTHGGFDRLAAVAVGPPVTRDQTAILGTQLSPAARALLAGSANYEDGLTNGALLRVYNLGQKSVSDGYPAQPSSVGPLCLGDIDGDGTLELFVGGQVLPGRYPEAASSLLLRNRDGNFHLDTAASKHLSNLGVVNGAVWADLDGDGLPELILACEWGPIRVFHWRAPELIEVTEQLGLNAFRGWWQSVQVGDFDGDGRLDIVAGNWGRNSKYQSHLKEPLRMFCGDVNNDGTWVAIDAYLAPDLQKVVPWRDFETLARAMPFLREHYRSFAEFSTAGISDILGDRKSRVQAFTANTLDSMVFLNRGDHFEGHPLPLAAQVAPTFGLVVADFNGDGNEDVVLTQNFFALPPDVSRYDGGRGLLLKGNGDGTFQPISGTESGLEIYGEGRGAAALDYDRDGRVDLVACQNANATKLYHNLSAKPGLRVRLNGPAGNPDGVGAVLRLRYASGRYGPARAVQAGGGYWSQDSAVQVLGSAEAVSGVSVKWPGGKISETPVDPGIKEITASATSQSSTYR